MILSSLLDFFCFVLFFCFFCFPLGNFWVEVLIFCVWKLLWGARLGGVQYDGEKRLLVFPHVPSLKPPLLED